MNVALHNTQGEQIGTIALPEAVFGMPVSVGLLHEVVQYYRAQQRRGTSSVKTRSEVRGGGKKPWRQKGTGRARAGSIRSPLWRKGGIIFGPHPRDFSRRMPRKKLRAALMQTLSDKAASGAVKVVESLAMFSDAAQKPKTKAVAVMMRKLAMPAKSILVIHEGNELLVRAARNIKGLSVTRFNFLNAYDVLAADQMLFDRESVEQLRG